MYLAMAPRALKLSVGLVEGIPGVSRLAKIHLSELLTHLLWNGGVRMTVPMVAQAVRLRLRRRPAQ